MIHTVLRHLKVMGGINSKKKRATRKNMKTSIKDHSRKYDVTSKLSNFLSGFTFRQMLRDYLIDLKKELGGLFAEKSGKMVNIISA